MRKFTIITILLTLFSCEPAQQKFNCKHWKYIDGTANHRDVMIQDLMENVLHKGMKYNEVESLLGKPNQGKFYKKINYEIYYEFLNEEHRVLTIYFSKDSTILKYSRVVWKS